MSITIKARVITIKARVITIKARVITIKARVLGNKNNEYEQRRITLIIIIVTLSLTKTSIVTIGSMKTVKTFFLAFPALNSTAMSKKLKYSNSYLIVAQIHT